MWLKIEARNLIQWRCHVDRKTGHEGVFKAGLLLVVAACDPKCSIHLYIRFQLFTSSYFSWAILKVLCM